MAEKRIPLRVVFDFENDIPAFGACVFKKHEDGQRLAYIQVNMAAILNCCAEENDMQWKELTADTIVHEVLHVLQHELGRVFSEHEVERALLLARGTPEEEIQAFLSEQPDDSRDAYLAALDAAECQTEEEFWKKAEGVA